VVLDKSAGVLELNRTAIGLLESEFQHTPEKRDTDWDKRAVKKLINRGRSRFTLNSETWITIPRETRRSLVLHAVPLETESLSGARVLLIMIDLDWLAEPSAAALQKMFELTPAEASLAIKISRGETPVDIARTNGVTIATVRSQLAAVFAKTRTQRQAELVALLGRVAIIPSPAGRQPAGICSQTLVSVVENNMPSRWQGPNPVSRNQPTWAGRSQATRRLSAHTNLASSPESSVAARMD
jgi:DNA-binding CsgD family transcriptional regulator